MLDLVLLLVKNHKRPNHVVMVEEADDADVRPPGVGSSLLSCALSKHVNAGLGGLPKAPRELLFDWLKPEYRQRFHAVHPRLLFVIKFEKQLAISREIVYLARMYQLKMLLLTCFSPDAPSKEPPTKDKKRTK